MIKIEPSTAIHQNIIQQVCKKHGVKSLELTSRHVELMDDCIEAFIHRPLQVGDNVLLEFLGYDEKPTGEIVRGIITSIPENNEEPYIEIGGKGYDLAGECFTSMVYKLI